MFFPNLNIFYASTPSHFSARADLVRMCSSTALTKGLDSKWMISFGVSSLYISVSECYDVFRGHFVPREEMNEFLGSDGDWSVGQTCEVCQ